MIVSEASIARRFASRDHLPATPREAAARDGRAAAVTHKLGKGSVTYIGVDTLAGDLEAAPLRKVWAGAGRVRRG